MADFLYFLGSFRHLQPKRAVGLLFLFLSQFPKFADANGTFSYFLVSFKICSNKWLYFQISWAVSEICSPKWFLFFYSISSFRNLQPQMAAYLDFLDSVRNLLPSMDTFFLLSRQYIQYLDNPLLTLLLWCYVKSHQRQPRYESLCFSWLSRVIRTLCSNHA
jgi:hypothetical protein